MRKKNRKMKEVREENGLRITMGEKKDKPKNRRKARKTLEEGRQGGREGVRKGARDVVCL